jgi:trigger factor
VSVKSAVETLNPTRVRLTVEVPFEELEPSVAQAYKRIAAQVTVPGFRKGKVPARIIDQRFGRAVVLEEAVNDALPRLYDRAVDENSLRPLGRPDVEVTELADNVELKFTAEVDIRPEITLPDLASLTVTVDDADVADEDVQTHLDALRERFATTTPADRPAAAGDYVTLDLTATEDGQPVEDGLASGVSYQIGSGTLVDGLDEAITGLTAGESVSFRSQLHGSHEGREVDITATVSAVKEQQLPELDDDFAQLASEFDTLEELTDDVRTRLRRTRQLDQVLAARDKALEALLDAVDLPVPEGFLAAQIEQHFEDGHGDDEHRSEFEAQTRRQIRAQLILDELVKAEGVGVEQDEVTEYLLRRAAEAQMDPNEYAKLVVEGGGVPAIISDVARGKALALVVERATVVDASGRPVDLTLLAEEDDALDQLDDTDALEAEDVLDIDEAAELDVPGEPLVEEPADLAAEPTRDQGDDR